MTPFVTIRCFERIFDQIKGLNFHFPKSFPLQARELILKLCSKTAEERISAAEVKAHPWGHINMYVAKEEKCEEKSEEKCGEKSEDKCGEKSEDKCEEKRITGEVCYPPTLLQRHITRFNFCEGLCTTRIYECV
ncbi:serine/threonine protein kinase, putative (ARK2) [Plasmodium ovale wallikeri]|uniref:Serine/threonine protein kinase, putative (ARK2) n=1 Tax=Plasmodium ovale wallikeri TaxID=864142 RepID=A0A1A8YSH9_PLAOA|nr:serine/threonine protein kinase, putative (ARK2) [Plasmodium ovale wallikeri]SBT35013.1 serine/threonine protein kinase, putative (ARK2) [Plasmodium ovale wallikeri]